MKSLQTKLLVFTFVAIAIFGIVLGIVFEVSIHNVIDDDSDRILTNYTLSEKEKVNNTLESIEQSVNIVADTVEEQFTSLSILESPDRYQLFSDYIDNLFKEVGLYTENASAFYFRFNYELTDSKAGFTHKIENGVVSNIESIDILAYDRNDIPHVGWYYQPLDAGHAVWIMPYSSAYTNNKIITYAVPVYYGELFIGVVGMNVNFDIITSLVASIDVYGEGSAYLVDSDDKIVFNTTIEEGSDRPPVSGTYVETEAELANGMKLVLGVDRSVVTKNSHKILETIIYIIVAFVVLAMLGMYIITRSIIHPLRELTEAAKKVENGNFDIELYHPSLDEVGMLSRSFQKTVDVLNEKMEFINKLAYTDSLTGLFNNTAYTSYTIQIERSIHERKFGLIIFDVNDLKKINDEYGHERGNELIVKAAQYIKNSFKNSNAYRIGGDEFAVILEDDDLRNCDTLLEKFDENLAEQTINIGSGKLRIDIARGIAIYSMANDYKFDDVFKRADKAMYQNKKHIKSNKKL